MSEVMSFAEIQRHEVELLPARTVLSVYSRGAGADGTAGADGSDEVHGGEARGADGHGSSAVVQNGTYSVTESSTTGPSTNGPGAPVAATPPADNLGQWLAALRSWVGVR